MSSSSSSPPPAAVIGDNRTILLRELPASVLARPLAVFLERFAKVRSVTIPTPMAFVPQFGNPPARALA